MARFPASRWLKLETPAERQWLGALGVTTTLHLGVLALLGMFVFATPGGLPNADVDSEWLGDDEEIDLTEVTLAPTDRVTNPDAGGRSADALRVLDRPTHEARLAELLRPTPVGDIPITAGELTGSDLLAPVAFRVGDTEPGNGEGNGTGDGTGNGDESGFFGLNVPGERFVFVVDASSSMQAPHDSEAKTRFGRVKLELVRSIGGMSPRQSFFVVFFNSEPHPMPARRLQPAHPVLVQQYLGWTTHFRPGGDTNPLPALEVAIALRPDVIYFLTDGVIPRGQNVLRRVKAANRGRVRLHTFAFGSRSGEDLLRVLAEENGGEYKFVP